MLPPPPQPHPAPIRGPLHHSWSVHFSLQFKRKSTEGVSFILFALVILGNTTYGLSVLLKNPDDGQGERSYVIHHLPWLIGSLGTLSLDVIVSLKEHVRFFNAWLVLFLGGVVVDPTYVLHFSQCWAVTEGWEGRSSAGVSSRDCLQLKPVQSAQKVKATSVTPGGHVSLCKPMLTYTNSEFSKWYYELYINDIYYILKTPGQSIDQTLIWLITGYVLISHDCNSSWLIMMN